MEKSGTMCKVVAAFPKPRGAFCELESLVFRSRCSLLLPSDLGASKVLIPEQDFGLGTTSRLLDVGAGAAGFHVGVMGFLQYDVRFTLDSTLRDFLTSDSSARPNTSYSVNVDGTVQAGFAPTIGYAGRLTHGAGGPDTDDGFYIGGALHYYMGATYGRGIGPAGFTTGNPVLAATSAWSGSPDRSRLARARTTSALSSRGPM